IVELEHTLQPRHERLQARRARELECAHVGDDFLRGAVKRIVMDGVECRAQLGERARLCGTSTGQDHGRAVVRRHRGEGLDHHECLIFGRLSYDYSGKPANQRYVDSATCASATAACALATVAKPITYDSNNRSGRNNSASTESMLTTSAIAC